MLRKSFTEMYLFIRIFFLLICEVCRLTTRTWCGCWAPARTRPGRCCCCSSWPSSAHYAVSCAEAAVSASSPPSPRRPCLTGSSSASRHKWPAACSTSQRSRWVEMNKYLSPQPLHSPAVGAQRPGHPERPLNHRQSLQDLRLRSDTGRVH